MPFRCRSLRMDCKRNTVKVEYRNYQLKRLYYETCDIYALGREEL